MDAFADYSKIFLKPPIFELYGRMNLLDLLIGVLGVYFLWAGKIVELMLLIIIWLLMEILQRF